MDVMSTFLGYFYNSLNVQMADRIIDEIIKTVKCWKEFAKEAGVGAEFMNRIDESN